MGAKAGLSVLCVLISCGLVLSSSAPITNKLVDLIVRVSIRSCRTCAPEGARIVCQGMLRIQLQKAYRAFRHMHDTDLMLGGSAPGPVWEQCAGWPALCAAEIR